MNAIPKLAAILLAITLAGCTTMPPRFGPASSVDDVYALTPTLPNAVKVAESMKKEYRAQIANRTDAEYWTGLGLVGMGVVAADLVARGIGRSELIGLAGIAGGTYAATSWTAGKPQQFIYAAGLNAVQCSVDAMQPLVLAYQDRANLIANVQKLRKASTDLAATLDDRYAANKDLSRVIRARAAIAKANAFLTAAESARRALDSAGQQLRSSLSAIESQVTQAYLGSVSLQSLTQSLGTTLPVTGNKILGIAAPGVPALATNIKTSGSEAELDAPVREIEALLAETEPIVDSVRTSPPQERLKLCSANFKDAGLEMTLTASELVVDAGKEGTLSVLGGQVPYRYDWVGMRPAAEGIDVAFDTGNGQFTLKTKPNAQTGTYTLLLTDRVATSHQTARIIIRSVGSPPAVPAPGTGTTTKNACTKVPEIEKMQNALIAKGVKTAKVNGVDKPLKADGCPGPITTQAMIDFHLTQVPGVALNAIPKDAGLVKAVSNLLGI